MRTLKTVIFLWVCQALPFGALAQPSTTPLEIRQDVTLYNLQSQRGVPISTTLGVPPGSDGRAPTRAEQLAAGLTPDPTTPNQFQGVVTFGALAAPNQPQQDLQFNVESLLTNTFLAASAERIGLPVGRSNGRVSTILLRARVAPPYISRRVSFLYGAVIPVPESDEYGIPLAITNATIDPPRLPQTPEEYWLPEPFTTNNHSTARYYWSLHAQRVFATQPGPVQITWRKSVPSIPSGCPTNCPNNVTTTLILGRTNTLYTKSYLISSSPIKPTRRMYWTERTYRATGKPIQVPAGRLSAVNIVFNNNFPMNVTEEFRPFWDIPRTPVTNTLQELRTLWYDQSLGQIFSYNREGRTFMELLGDSFPDGVRRQHLGFEIVDIISQPNPSEVEIELGERVTAYQDGVPSDADLFPEPIELPSESFMYQRSAPDNQRIELYANRETTNLNDAQVHWLEEGLEGLRWPKRFVRYLFVWPDNIRSYRHYVRPKVDAEEEAKRTAVPLPGLNAPTIDYQDPLDRPRAKLTEEFGFYTWLTPEYPVHRTLLRLISGENVVFERIFSWLDEDLKTLSMDPSNAFDRARGTTPITHLNSWNATNEVLELELMTGLDIPRVVTQTALVGNRITAPAGELGAGPDDDYVAGYILQEKGDLFHPGAYVDPFETSFEQASQGAIIPVNAIPNRNHLEVWWFRDNEAEEDKGFEQILWPSVIGRYTLRWPDDASEIVLASNQGSGALVRPQAEGKVYAQNGPGLPGYNPNEEHALIQGGRVYALRDDLNVTHPTDLVSYSSHPFVLLEYAETDERPAMRVFEVLREDLDEGIVFDYLVEAGSILQPPMPLPLMEKPSLPQVPGSPVMSLNHEVPISPPDPNPRSKFTFQDRKQNSWVYRGPHDPSDPDARTNMQMRFYYKTLPGFWFPEEGTQPAIGTLTPYLRSIDNDGTFAGVPFLDSSFSDTTDTNALAINYRPVWPEDAPVLQMAETLTLAKRGLPSVRGQTSIQVFYQQSQIAEDLTRISVVLHDPTREKEFKFGPADTLPDSIQTEDLRGKVFFPRLPPHLVERLFFDPSRGEHGTLVFKGEFVDAPLGEDYLSLNVLGEMERATLKGLADADDAQKATWDTAIDGLSTSMEIFVENRGKPGTFVADTSSVFRVNATELAVVTDDDTAVDSYALTAIGPGTGFVTLVAGDGRAFTPEEEPVSLYVLKVVDTLYRGEVHVVGSSNPLNEKLTLQQVIDLAGAVEQYRFEWKIAPPLDGLPPPVLQHTPRELLSEPNWSHVRFPVASDEIGTIHNIEAQRTSKEALGGLVIPVSRIDFSQVTATNDQLRFTTSTAGFALVSSNQVLIRTRDNTEVFGTLAPQTTPTEAVVELDDPNNATNLKVVALSERVVTNQPQSILFADFDLDPNKAYAQLWLSLDLDSALGAKVYLDGQPVVRSHTGERDTSTTSAPSRLSPLSQVYRLPTAALAGGTPNPDGTVKHRVAVELFSEALPDTQQAFDLRLEAFESTDVTSEQWLPLDEERFQDGVRAVLGGTADVRSLSDQYVIMRYQAATNTHASWKSDPENKGREYPVVTVDRACTGRGMDQTGLKRNQSLQPARNRLVQ